MDYRGSKRNHGDERNLKTDMMESVKTIILAILLVVFVINLMGIYIGFIIDKTILQPTFLINTLKEQAAYAQIRQVMFRMVNESLPNSQDSIPYLRESISEDWLEEEINLLLKDFYGFAKGKRDATPTISFSNLKSQVVDSLDANTSRRNREKLVQFWFDPLPDEVHLEDFMSIDFLWGIRKLASIAAWIPWILCGSALILISLIYLLVRDWKQLILWFGSGGIAAGVLLVFLSLVVGWAIGHMSLVMNMVERLISYEIPETSVNGFLATLVNGITNPMDVLGAISVLIGGIIIYFIPIDERVLFLVK